MPNYKKMYFALFNEVTDVIAQLQKIQRETEEIYVSEQPLEIKKTQNTPARDK